MDRRSKELFVAQLQTQLNAASLVVATRQTGLSVAEMEALRADVRQAQAFFKIPKNTLARIALKGTPHSALEPVLSGPMALAYSTDPVAAARAVCGFSKKNPKLEVVSGILNGALLNAAQVKALADLPSLDELRAKVLGLLVAPASQLARLVGAPGAQLARVFNAYATRE